MPDQRRDNRIEVELPFLLIDQDGSAGLRCKALDISPTGILLEIDEDQAPALGSIVTVSVQGPAEDGWEHINSRPMLVVRVLTQQTGLTYIDATSV